MRPASDPAHSEFDTGKNPFQHLRRTPRFKAFEDRQIAVVVQRAVGCEPREFRGRILDLSTGGAKMAVPHEIALQETINVRFDLPEVTADLSVAAHICWARTAGGNGWRLGCSFTQELPESLLSQLAIHGYIDRREANRQTAHAAAAVQWEVGRESTPIRLQDVSVGGFSFLCPNTAANGTALQLLLTAGDGEFLNVPAVVRWQRETTGGFLLGCAYAEEGALRKVEHALSSGLETVGLDASPMDRRPMGSAAFAATEGGQPGSRRRLSIELAARSADRQLLAAGAMIAGSFGLLICSPQLDPLGWGTTAVAMLGGVLATARYHRLTQQVVHEAAEAARNGKLY